MEITILSGAETDLFSAWVRYEEIVPGLGERFHREAKTALAQIANFPESAPLFAGEFRRILVRRFEHGIFYRVHGTRIIVTAVLNLRQDPATIAERLAI